MFTIIMWIIVLFCFGIATLITIEYDRQPNERELFIGELDEKRNLLNIKEAMIFSNVVLARSIKKRLRKGNIQEVAFLPYCGDEYYLRKNDSIANICYKLESLQTDSDCKFDNPSDRLVYSLWCDYAYNPRYRKMVGNILLEMYMKKEVCENLYYKAKKKLYKYIAF